MDRVSQFSAFSLLRPILTLPTVKSRLKEFKDTMSLYIFALDLVSRTYPAITKVDGLPYDCASLIPCSSALGGVVILTSNAVIHVDQATRRVALPVNGWQPRVSDMPTLPMPVGMHELRLESARMAFVEERTLFVVLIDGTIVPFEFVVDGKVVSRLVMGAALAQTTSPTVVRKVHGGHLFVGSMVGPSVLLRTASVEELVTDADDMATSGPAAVVDAGNAMDLDDDDGATCTRMAPSIANESVFHRHIRYIKSRPVTLCHDRAIGEDADRDPSLTMRLASCVWANFRPDVFPREEWGKPRAALSLRHHAKMKCPVFALLQDRYVPELVTATGSGSLGGFTLFQVPF